MNSKVTIEFDFDNNEPFLKVYQNSQGNDMRDNMMKAFLEDANQKGIELVYKDDTPQIRIKKD